MASLIILLAYTHSEHMVACCSIASGLDGKWAASHRGRRGMQHTQPSGEHTPVQMWCRPSGNLGIALRGHEWTGLCLCLSISK